MQIYANEDLWVLKIAYSPLCVDGKRILSHNLAETVNSYNYSYSTQQFMTCVSLLQFFAERERALEHKGSI